MPDYEQKPLKHIAGIVGQDPEIKKGDWGEFTTFSVATTRSYGDDGETRWYGATVNKEALQNWVNQNLHKGSRVVLEGVPSKRTYNGQDRYNFAAFRVGLVDWAQLGGGQRQSVNPQQAESANDDNWDDDDL